MPATNKAFVVVTPVLRVNVDPDTASLNFNYVVINPDGVPVAGGSRSAFTAPLERADGQNDIRSKIEAAVRIDLNDPSVDIVIV